VPPKVLLITPPFTQLNTPYPATAYIKGFLNTKNIPAKQADFGIAVILKLFSKTGLQNIVLQKSPENFSDNAKRIYALWPTYCHTIDAVIQFLQGKNPALALQICQGSFLPQASRFSQLEELDWAFGTMGLQDKAKHLATLYLEDISDFIVACVDENFGFSRYAERLGRSANSFDDLYHALQQKPTYIETILFSVLESQMSVEKPDLFLISVPFPGNLFAAFRCAQWMKKHYPNTKIAMGGGFPNTELRSLADVRVFEFFDFITLDDGELPVELLIENLQKKPVNPTYKRTFILENNKVVYKNNAVQADYKQNQVGTPDYSDLPLSDYISVIEMANPMHSLWSDGRWNKLTMAHGCYWGKCTFCDVSLDYIKIYEPVRAQLLCDRMEEMIAQTGQSGFHFVDEAAPPALMRELALEILKRNLIVTWWTNIRFEKSFSADLCLLLKKSGCVAVSGGLEVASDRLLDLIKKGVTVAQVAKVTQNFTQNGIMVHAYLMYGYPTQTVQETVDSLEMVRQLFEIGVLQSGFWHQFALTAHSPIGLNPDDFGIKKDTEVLGTFANNDILFTDRTGIDHEKFSFGLKKSLFNYMHGLCFEYDLQEWFDFKIPKTKIPHDYIEKALENETVFYTKPTAKIVWLGNKPEFSFYTKTKKGKQFSGAQLTFWDNTETFSLKLDEANAYWLLELLDKANVYKGRPQLFENIKHNFENQLEDFELFWYSKQMISLRTFGLLTL
jgi:hypothetical protein